ncbi:MAG: hypothetical protein LBD37_07885 [Treponema sp.]|jgi:hypothetical protein|nr:hypothetical protein [Treponema sp.]
MKRYGLLGLFVSAGALLFGASEELERYTAAYQNAATTTAKLAVVRQVADAGIAEAAGFYALALERLVADYPNIRTGQELEIKAANTMARLLAEQLGNAQYRDAARNLWRAEQSFPDSLVKADMLIALGKAGAVEFLPQVVKVLQDLNLRPPQDPLEGERVAYGAIIALENYKDASGYLPVFFASTGWYSDRIKNQAKASLPRILEDPTEPLSSVVKSPGYPHGVKYLALQTQEESWVSNDKKAFIAAAALQEGWKASTSDVRQRGDLGGMRKLALDMLRRYGTAGQPVYPLMERSYQEGIDAQEKYAAVTALASLKTDEAVGLLNEFLLGLNGKLKNGVLKPADEQMVRTLIPALGATGNPKAAESLETIQNLDWTHTVKMLAVDALGKTQSQ